MDKETLHDLRKAAELADCVTMDEAKDTGLEYAERFVEAAKFLLDELEPPKPRKLDGFAAKASKRLLEAKGYEVLDDSGAFDAAAIADDGTVVLVDADVSYGGGIPEPRTGASARWSCEKRAAEFMASRSDGFRRIRFDHAGLSVNERGEAMVRHTVNVFGEGE